MDLCKILNSLQNSVTSCNVVRARSPSYVRVHTGIDHEVLLVNVKNKQWEKSTAISNLTSTGDENKEVLELTGSPLKLDLSLRNILDDTVPLDETQNWSRDEITHLPTTLQNARNVCNHYLKLTREFENDHAVPLWVVTNGQDEKRTLLLCAHSFKNYFNRGIVSYEGEVLLENISLNKLAPPDMNLEVQCRIRVAGMSYTGYLSSEELIAAPHAGLTQLCCKWTQPVLEVPAYNARVTLEQEVIVGHELSPCRVLWRSICALHNVNRALVDIAAAGYQAIDLKHVTIRAPSSAEGPSLSELTRRVNQLVSEVETYTYTATSQRGGCTFVPDDSTSLKLCLDNLTRDGSSNDFLYQLWDILRDSETADDMISLLLHALKSLSSGKMKPFITPSNKTYLAKLILKLSRGHSQTPVVLKNLLASPQQTLSLLGQLALDKTSWELSHLLTVVDHSFSVSDAFTPKSSEDAIEQINQTIHDMTMGAGDLTLNPFDNRSFADTSVRLADTIEDEAHELSCDNFASLRMHGLGGDKKTPNEVPLIVDEIDIGGWKATLMKFAQVYVVLEHLSRMQQCLRLDMANLSCRARELQEHYCGDKSPVRTCSQLLSEPAQAYSTPVSAAPLRDHLNNKLASFYRVRVTRKPPSSDAASLETVTTTHVFSHQPVFPPCILRPVESESETHDSTIAGGIRYHHTIYTHIATNIRTMPFDLTGKSV